MVVPPPFPPYLILTVDVTGLIGNLKSCSPSMFRFYSILKSWGPDDHITQEEINIASGKQPLTAEASSEFLGGLEAQSENIKNAFAKQREQAAVCTYYVSSMAFYDQCSSIIHRGCGIRINLRSFSPSGLSPPTNPLIQSIIQSLWN